MHICYINPYKLQNIQKINILGNAIEVCTWRIILRSWTYNMPDNSSAATLAAVQKKYYSMVLCNLQKMTRIYLDICLLMIDSCSRNILFKLKY